VFSFVQCEPKPNLFLDGQTMTIRRTTAQWLLAASLSTALGASFAACGSDNSKETEPSTRADASASTGDATVGAPNPGAGDASADSKLACPSKVYSALSAECSACACNVDPVLAPSCQKPCWDFLACSFTAQTGKCAASAAGGAATRPEFEACTMEQCGDLLAIPGAEVVSSYRTIIGACAVSMGGAKAACGDDITKFQSALRKP
jgi:hypothetical protein